METGAAEKNKNYGSDNYKKVYSSELASGKLELTCMNIIDILKKSYCVGRG